MVIKIVCTIMYLYYNIHSKSYFTETGSAMEINIECLAIIFNKSEL